MHTISWVSPKVNRGVSPNQEVSHFFPESVSDCVADPSRVKMFLIGLLLIGRERPEKDKSGKSPDTPRTKRTQPPPKEIFWRTFLASKKNFPGRWWIQKPYKNQENHIHHRNLSSVDPIFFLQRKVPALEQGGGEMLSVLLHAFHCSGIVGGNVAGKCSWLTKRSGTSQSFGDLLHKKSRNLSYTTSSCQFLSAQRAANGGSDPSWLNLAFLGRPDFPSRGPKTL